MKGVVMIYNGAAKPRWAILLCAAGLTDSQIREVAEAAVLLGAIGGPGPDEIAEALLWKPETVSARQALWDAYRKTEAVQRGAAPSHPFDRVRKGRRRRRS